MGWPGLGRLRERHPWLGAHLAQKQHRNAYYLMLSQVLGAATGVLFWLLFARIVPSEAIGIGASIVLSGTAIGVVAKGGFDTAIVRSVPQASSSEARALLRFAVLAAAAAAVVMTLLLALAAGFTRFLPTFSAPGWWLVGAVAVLLVVTWLQDAYFLAAGDARFAFHRNVVLSVGRIVLPIPVVLLAFPHPVAATWTFALVASALAALLFMARFPVHAGRLVPRWGFVARATRNVMGGAAEFLPGLVLVPMLLVIRGASEAGHFAIAWSAASMLFIASASIGRSALSELAGAAPGEQAAVIRRGTLQHAVILGPAALVGVLLAPQIMGIFGSDYARASTSAFMVLCASILVVAPSYLYLTVLRVQDRAVPLVLFPLAMLALIFLLVPIFEARFGLTGVALAWLFANVPFGLYATWRLSRHARGSPGERVVASLT